MYIIQISVHHTNQIKYDYYTLDILIYQYCFQAINCDPISTSSSDFMCHQIVKSISSIAVPPAENCDVVCVLIEQGKTT